MKEPVGKSLRELSNNELEMVYGANEGAAEPYFWSVVVKTVIKVTAAAVTSALSSSLVTHVFCDS